MLPNGISVVLMPFCDPCAYKQELFVFILPSLFISRHAWKIHEHVVYNDENCVDPMVLDLCSRQSNPQHARKLGQCGGGPSSGRQKRTQTHVHFKTT